MIGASHQFSPSGNIGTQCAVFGCWGWVDDPRHVRDVRARIKYPPVPPTVIRTPPGVRGRASRAQHSR